MGGNVALELTSVDKSFKNNSAVVKDINLSVTRGQVVALIGDSGAGKQLYCKSQACWTSQLQV